MKQAILGFTAIALLSMTAQAQMITDHLNCYAALEDLRKPDTNAKTWSPIVAVRKKITTDHLGNPYPKNVEVTAAETNLGLNLNQSDSNANLSLKLRYVFAVKVDANGQPMEARQTICQAMSIMNCKNGMCSSADVACLELDPFDPASGWAGTGVYAGIPVFNEKLLTLSQAILTDEAGTPGIRATVQCSFSGTYY